MRPTELGGSGDVASNTPAFDASERYMRLRGWRRYVRLPFDVGSAAGGAAERCARPVGADESEHLGGIVRVRARFTHTILLMSNICSSVVGVAMLARVL